ncbi:MAG: hypothetical protein ABL921_03135, partial [Pirellula sp.]
MKTVAALLVASFVVSCVVGSVQAQEKGAKGNQAAQMTKAFMKQLEKGELSDEQTTRVKELFTKVAKDVSLKRTEGGITAEVLKKRTEAGKAAREAGKKG